MKPSNPSDRLNAVMEKLEAVVKNWTPPRDNEAPLTEPSTEAKLWVLKQIAKFIRDTEAQGSFRKLIYEYLDLDYTDAYLAGGMDIINSLSHENYKEFVGKVFILKTDESELIK